MPYQLVVVQGRSTVQAHKLGPGVTTVGRQEDCQLRIRSSLVSRKHCQLFEKKGLLLVKDLGSSNGTLVNGKKVEDQRVLEAGDELSIGPIKLRVEKVEAAAAAAGKPGDTAVAQPVPLEEVPVAVGEADVFEIDLDADTPTGDTQTTVAPAAPAAPAAKSKAAEPAKPAEPEPIGEEAVAEFLLNIDLDDEDKR
jgi:pSer/pThr/pTyr-binding forkhead associated (FHA) protein